MLTSFTSHRYGFGGVHGRAVNLFLLLRPIYVSVAGRAEERMWDVGIVCLSVQILGNPTDNTCGFADDVTNLVVLAVINMFPRCAVARGWVSTTLPAISLGTPMARTEEM